MKKGVSKLLGRSEARDEILEVRDERLEARKKEKTSSEVYGRMTSI